ncbi:vascular cell adhesion molecule 1 [Chelydra serpentina]|uniref:Vascular cell adhesion molecule 1 n=1 Tax=Chelydra serpentina TaxID=8475 RepID=A0A8T1SZD3_CHESE|nr:vascular cell adhesion molecule 1 [Chelydra serpentina]
MGRIIPSVTVLLLVFVTSKAFEIEITPEHKVAAQIGDKLELTCSTIGCESPSFSWRSQLDKPLGGSVNIMGNSCILTMDPVGIENEHEYLCSAFCDNVKKEKSIKVDVYSFPSDPVIETSTPLNVGEKASITCMVPKVFPSERLMMQLAKDGSVLYRKDFNQEGITETTETKSLTLTFIPTFEDIGKEITCVAELPIDEMEFEPKKRQTSQRLSVNFGPQNTNITVSSSNRTMQGETLMLICRTTSNPPARIVWGKELEDSSVQHIIDNDTLIIPHTQMSDSGLFICEAINDATNKTERTTVVISVEGAPRITEFSIQPSTTVQEGDNVTILCSAESNPAARIVLKRKSNSEDTVLYSEDGVVHISSVTFLNAGNYECEAENALGESKMAAELSVEYGPRNTTVSVTPSTTVREGGAVTMTCTSYGNPSPKISWTKHLISGESHFLSEDATLTINNVKTEDLGLYECEGVNQFGRERKTVDLIVEVPPKDTVLSVLPSDTVKEGDSVTFSCTSEGIPAVQIILRKKTGGADTVLVSESGRYTIYGARLEDAGMYECESSNELGQQFKNIMLDVKVPPQNTTELISPSDNFDERENITIMSTSYSNSPPQTVPQKIHLSNTTILTSQNDTSTLCRVIKNDTGTYLIAYNETGNNTDVIEIAVVEIVKGKDYMIPVIVVLSLSTMAVPALAILVYISRKAKINGSYSPVNAPKPNV